MSKVIDLDGIDPEFLRVVKRLAVDESNGARGEIRVGPYTAYTLIGAIQMCMRHPGLDLDGPMGNILADLAGQLGRYVLSGYAEDDPDREILQKIIDMGFDPANDR